MHAQVSSTWPFVSFSYLALGTAYVLHTLSWTLSIIVALSVLLTGVSADAGHRWAAGNRSYRPIA
jgi:hypothetical protein